MATLEAIEDMQGLLWCTGSIKLQHLVVEDIAKTPILNMGILGCLLRFELKIIGG